jgi:3-methyladenine DNA glycosylase AlkD
MPTTPTLAALRRRLAALADPKDAAFLQRFFKTGPGEYAEGDRFLGIRVPVSRAVAREFRGLPLDDVLTLLRSPLHEERLVALVLMTHAYAKGDAATRERVYRAYLANTKHINNWDLVDISAPGIVGAHLHGRDTRPLDRLARSRSLWERRIAIVATQELIRRGDFAPTLRIAETLLDDDHDLIHKAVGWMLREVGKRDQATADAFLDRHCRVMPRTMLRYAIEKLPERRRRELMTKS